MDSTAADSRSAGFPEGHPPIHSLLGVAIPVRGHVYGNLYLTDRRDGRPFDADDESVVVALAGAAGVAIENARLYEQVRNGAEQFQRLLLPSLPDLAPFTSWALACELRRPAQRPARPARPHPAGGRRPHDGDRVHDPHRALRGRLVAAVEQRRAPSAAGGRSGGLPRHDHQHVLPPGVTVPMFADGLYEHPKRDMDDALRTVAEVAVAHAGRPLDVLGKAVADARPSDGHDDMAVLALRAPGRPAKCGA